MKHVASSMVILGAVCAQAIEPPGWPELKQRLLDHPNLRVARDNAGDTRNVEAHAGKRPLPVVELEVENFGGTGDAAGFSRSSVGLWVGTGFRSGDVAGAERALAREEALSAGRDTLLARRDLLWQVRWIWEDWLQARWKASLLDSNASDLQSWESALEAARLAGRAEPWEVSQVRADRIALEGLSRAIRDRATASWAALIAHGAQATEPVETEEPAALGAPGSGGGISPDSVRMVGEVERARAEAHLATEQARPGVDAALGVLTDAATGSVGLGARVAVPLPPWNRIGMEGARARALAQRVRRSAELAGWHRTQERERLAREIEASHRAWANLVDTVVPARLSAAASAMAAYRRGAIPPETVGRMRDGVWRTRLEALERLESLRRLQLELRNLEGVEP